MYIYIYVCVCIYIYMYIYIYIYIYRTRTSCASRGRYRASSVAVPPFAPPPPVWAPPPPVWAARLRRAAAAVGDSIPCASAGYAPPALSMSRPSSSPISLWLWLSGWLPRFGSSAALWIRFSRAAAA